MTEAKQHENRGIKFLAWFFAIWAVIPTGLALTLLSVFERLSEQDLLMILLLCAVGLISIVGGGVLMAIYQQGEYTLNLTHSLRDRTPRRA